MIGKKAARRRGDAGSAERTGTQNQAHPPLPTSSGAVRLELGLTQEAFGRALGLAGKYCAHTVSRWERGLAPPNSASLYILRSRIKTVRRQRELERSL